MSSFQRQWMMPDDQAPTMRLVRDEPDAPAADDVAADHLAADDAAAVDADMNHDDAGAELAVAELDAGGREDLGTMRLGFDRRSHRRFDVESLDVSVERWGGRPGEQAALGRVVDLSAGGLRLRTRQPGVCPDQQIRVRLELPNTGGIWPFVDTANGQFRPKREWVGWLAVGRVTELPDGTYDVGGRLVDMEDMDRGMLGLYLSTQPLAA